MQVILLEKVAKLGGLGDVVKVKDGYARNFLIPTGAARRATEKAIQEFEARRVELEKGQADKLAAAQAAGEKLNGKSVTIAQKAGVDGRLFGSVTNADIAEELNKLGYKVVKSQVRMPNGPIKMVGDSGGQRCNCTPTWWSRSTSRSTAKPPDPARGGFRPRPGSPKAALGRFLSFPERTGFCTGHPQAVKPTVVMHRLCPVTPSAWRRVRSGSVSQGIFHVCSSLSRGRRFFAVDRQSRSLRVPPHSIEAESSVLGGLLLDNGAWDRVGDLLVRATSTATSTS
jgi:large subunit ribosomal protein L9